MKLLVFSDTHGYSKTMLDIISDEKPDLIVHLGDGGPDTDEIKKQFPHIPLKAVRGNCDRPSLLLPEMEIFMAGGLKILITHGHAYSVKKNLAALIAKANSTGVDLVMYGHTHIPDWHMSGNLRVLNPGACGNSQPQSYARIKLSMDGYISCDIVSLR